MPIDVDSPIGRQGGAGKPPYELIKHGAVGHFEGIGDVDDGVATINHLDLGGLHQKFRQLFDGLDHADVAYPNQPLAPRPDAEIGVRVLVPHSRRVDDVFPHFAHLESEHADKYRMVGRPDGDHRVDRYAVGVHQHKRNITDVFARQIVECAAFHFFMMSRAMSESENIMQSRRMNLFMGNLLHTGLIAEHSRTASPFRTNTITGFYTS